ncbi:nuclear transport factor 2 family protein [Phenylobacterium sp.]|uniref:nuclear transport factor 2 family protein n=1 Tax=Phenylobacterium sp. TaxID=1871053 RepID=UPI002810C9C3|nr:nuclear transport factor 2 family protein [Phenylobacterium sp.]
MRAQLFHPAVGILLMATVASFFLIAPAALGQTAGTPSKDEGLNALLVSQKFDAWRDGSGGPYDLLDEKARWTITGNSLAAKTYPNREAFMREVIRPFNARMAKPLSPTIRRLYTEGDTVVVFFDAVGVARDGKAYENTYAWFLRMQHGRIVEAHAFFDSLAFDDLWRRVAPVADD